MTERRRRRVVSIREASGGGGGPAEQPSVDARRPARVRGARTETSGAPDTPWAGADLDPVVAERGLRGLVGGGSSQVSTRAAMRARDAARPRPDDLARAEAELQIVRRHWTPRD